MNQATIARIRFRQMLRASKPFVLHLVAVSKPGGPAMRRLARVSSRCGVEKWLPEHMIEGERDHARISTNRGYLRPAAG